MYSSDDNWFNFRIKINEVMLGIVIIYLYVDEKWKYLKMDGLFEICFCVIMRGFKCICLFCIIIYFISISWKEY